LILVLAFIDIIAEMIKTGEILTIIMAVALGSLFLAIATLFSPEIREIFAAMSNAKE